jgi:hypothetical protein
MVKQLLQSSDGVDLQVVGALGADKQIGFEVPAPDDLAAPLAFQPQAFGPDMTIPPGGLRFLILTRLISFEPRHVYSLVSKRTPARG